MDALRFLAPRSGVTPSTSRQPRRLGLESTCMVNDFAALLRLCCRGLCGRFARLRRVYEFSTLSAKNRIHAELLRLATLAPRLGKRHAGVLVAENM